MYVIGMNPYQGLISKTDYLRGKGMTPGTMGSVSVNGDTKTFVAVKLAAATWINGTVVQIDTASGAAFAAAVGSAPSSLSNSRLGVLAFASASATQTVNGTVIGFAQVYGQAPARVQVATMSVPGIAMILASLPGQLRPAAAGLASAQADIEGITAVGTGSVNGLYNVFLNFPRLTGPFDLNVA